MNRAALFPAGLAGLIYDCDGVMIDSAEGNRHLYNLVLDRLGLAPMTREQEKFAFQATFEQALLYMVPERLHSQIEAAARGAFDYERDILPKIRLMRGYRDFVLKAREHGLRQAIDTNRTAFGIDVIIARFELEPYFEPVINSSNTEPKPSPEGVRKIAAAWGREPERILYIGDSPDDRLAAKGAGALFCAFGANDLEGDIKFASWPELASFLWN